MNRTYGAAKGLEIDFNLGFKYTNTACHACSAPNLIRPLYGGDGAERARGGMRRDKISPSDAFGVYLPRKGGE